MNDAESVGGFPSPGSLKIAGMTDRQAEDREWYYPPVADAMVSARIWPIKKYIQRHKATIEAHMACRPIYDLCSGAERVPGYS